MNIKSVKSFALLFLCFVSMHTKSMERPMQGALLLCAIGIVAALVGWHMYKLKVSCGSKVMFADEGKELCVTTQDEHKIKIPKDIVRHCERLRWMYYCYNNQKREQFQLKYAVNERELNTFVQAAQKPTCIDYDKNLSAIMKVADNFGAYTLYAYCISNYFGGFDGLAKDIDIVIFDIFKQLMRHRAQPHI